MCLCVCFGFKACFFGCFTSHSIIIRMEKWPLPVRGFKILLMLGIHGHWAVRVFLRVTTAVTRESVYNFNLWWSFPSTHDIHMCCRAFGNGNVTSYFYTLVLPRPGIEPRSSTFMANPLLVKPARRFYFFLNSQFIYEKAKHIKISTFNVLILKLSI